LAGEDYPIGPWTDDAHLIQAKGATTGQTIAMTVTSDNPSGVAGVCSAYLSTTPTHYIQCTVNPWVGVGHVDASNGNHFIVDSTTSGSITTTPAVRLMFNCNPNLNGGYCVTNPLITGSCGAGCWVFDGPAITDAAAQGSSACGHGAGGPVSADLPCRTAVRLDVNGWYFKDAGFSMSGITPITFRNNHVQGGLDWCTTYGNGLGQIQLGGGNIVAYSNIGDQDGVCKSTANLYKQAADPGLASMGSFTGQIVNGILTVDAGSCNSSCTITQNQFIDFPGRTSTDQVQLTTPVSGFPVFCTGSACDGYQIIVSYGPCGRTVGLGSQGTCKQSPNDTSTGAYTGLSTSAGTAFTVGPIYPSMPYMLAGGGYWTTIDLRYNITAGSYLMQGDGLAGINIAYNACRLLTFVPEHAACFVNNTTPPTNSVRPYYDRLYNIAWYDNTARGGAGTANHTIFMTTGFANPAGIDIATTEATFSHNFMFSNVGVNNGGLNASPSGTAPVLALTAILEQGVGTHPGTIGTLTYDTNIFGLGGNASCRAGTQERANVGTIVSTNNWNLDNNAATICPDTT
jgi:hypothetical protein